MTVIDLNAAAPFLSAYDGDTIHIAHWRVAGGWRKDPADGSKWVLVRLRGISCIELKDKQTGAPVPGGLETRDVTTRMCGPAAAELELRGVQADHYGNRIDAYVWVNGLCVNDELVRTGWAVPWNGQGRAPYPAWPIVPPLASLAYTGAARDWTPPPNTATGWKVGA